MRRVTNGKNTGAHTHALHTVHFRVNIHCLELLSLNKQNNRGGCLICIYTNAKIKIITLPEDERTGGCCAAN